MSDNDDFFDRVYSVTRLIPFGKVTSYGAIAAAIGSPGAARMVGWALNKSLSQTPFVPAHRVVNRNGILSGKHYFGGSNTMQELLENEGVKVVDDKIVDFKLIFWDPKSEL
ncbi:cysteine methyltransferase [Alkalitalea saponilacus]|nr:MGMT family protein [Alkalitalea saponilacus]ASB49479.1 cysteine methyltransferase [Alkalitalea saponilacus]